MSISDESTIVKNNEEPMDNGQERSISKDISWKSVVIGGVPGILLGSAGSLLATNHHKEADDEVLMPEEEPIDEVEVLKEEVSALKEEVSALREDLASHEAESQISHIGHAVDVASGISDSMSFSEAFASARAEVGPGGVFTWHGNVYSTYYENEWDNMTDAQKHDYAVAVHNLDYNHEPSAGYSGYDAPDDGEIHVLSEEQVETENGEMVHVTRVEMDGHYGEVYDFNNDGQPDAALIDDNDDGLPDVALIDENHDGLIDENEVYEVSDPRLMDVDNELYGDMPDYVNDADPSSFV